MAHKEMKAELSCPICMELFHQPRRLPCGHAYCHRCISTLLQVRAQQEWSISRRLVCPECRDEMRVDYVLGVEALPIDFKLSRLVELVRNMQTNSSNSDDASESASPVREFPESRPDDDGAPSASASAASSSASTPSAPLPPPPSPPPPQPQEPVSATLFSSDGFDFNPRRRSRSSSPSNLPLPVDFELPFPDAGIAPPFDRDNLPFPGLPRNEYDDYLDTLSYSELWEEAAVALNNFLDGFESRGVTENLTAIALETDNNDDNDDSDDSDHQSVPPGSSSSSSSSGSLFRRRRRGLSTSSSSLSTYEDPDNGWPAPAVHRRRRSASNNNADTDTTTAAADDSDDAAAGATNKVVGDSGVDSSANDQTEKPTPTTTTVVPVGHRTRTFSSSDSNSDSAALVRVRRVLNCQRDRPPPPSDGVHAASGTAPTTVSSSASGMEPEDLARRFTTMRQRAGRNENDDDIESSNAHALREFLRLREKFPQVEQSLNPSDLNDNASRENEGGDENNIIEGEDNKKGKDNFKIKYLKLKRRVVNIFKDSYSTTESSDEEIAQERERQRERERKQREQREKESAKAYHKRIAKETRKWRMTRHLIALILSGSESSSDSENDNGRRSQGRQTQAEEDTSGRVRMEKKKHLPGSADIHNDNDSSRVGVPRLGRFASGNSRRQMIPFSSDVEERNGGSTTNNNSNSIHRDEMEGRRHHYRETAAPRLRSSHFVLGPVVVNTGTHPRVIPPSPPHVAYPVPSIPPLSPLLPSVYDNIDHGGNSSTPNQPQISSSSSLPSSNDTSSSHSVIRSSQADASALHGRVTTTTTTSIHGNPTSTITPPSTHPSTTQQNTSNTVSAIFTHFYNYTPARQLLHANRRLIAGVGGNISDTTTTTTTTTPTAVENETINNVQVPPPLPLGDTSAATLRHQVRQLVNENTRLIARYGGNISDTTTTTTTPTAVGNETIHNVQVPPPPPGYTTAATLRDEVRQLVNENTRLIANFEENINDTTTTTTTTTPTAVEMENETINNVQVPPPPPGDTTATLRDQVRQLVNENICLIARFGGNISDTTTTTTTTTTPTAIEIGNETINNVQVPPPPFPGDTTAATFRDQVRQLVNENTRMIARFGGNISDTTTPTAVEMENETINYVPVPLPPPGGTTTVSLHDQVRQLIIENTHLIANFEENINDTTTTTTTTTPTAVEMENETINNVQVPPPPPGDTTAATAVTNAPISSSFFQQQGSGSSGGAASPPPPPPRQRLRLASEVEGEGATLYDNVGEHDVVPVFHRRGDQETNEYVLGREGNSGDSARQLLFPTQAKMDELKIAYDEFKSHMAATQGIYREMAGEDSTSDNDNSEASTPISISQGLNPSVLKVKCERGESSHNNNLCDNNNCEMESLKGESSRQNAVCSGFSDTVLKKAFLHACRGQREYTLPDDDGTEVKQVSGADSDHKRLSHQRHHRSTGHQEVEGFEGLQDWGRESLQRLQSVMSLYDNLGNRDQTESGNNNVLACDVGQRDNSNRVSGIMIRKRGEREGRKADTDNGMKEEILNRNGLNLISAKERDHSNSNPSGEDGDYQRKHRSKRQGNAEAAQHCDNDSKKRIVPTVVSVSVNLVAAAATTTMEDSIPIPTNLAAVAAATPIIPPIVSSSAAGSDDLLKQRSGIVGEKQYSSTTSSDRDNSNSNRLNYDDNNITNNNIISHIDNNNKGNDGDNNNVCATTGGEERSNIQVKANDNAKIKKNNNNNNINDQVESDLESESAATPQSAMLKLSNGGGVGGAGKKPPKSRFRKFISSMMWVSSSSSSDDDGDDEYDGDRDDNGDDSDFWS